MKNKSRNENSLASSRCARFAVTVDRRNRLSTLLLCGFMLAAMVICWFSSADDIFRYIMAVILLLVGGVLPILIYVNLPRQIEVTPTAILLHCPTRVKSIPRSETTEIRRIQDHDLQIFFRKWGSSGMFGNWGHFSSKLYPDMFFYTKRNKKDWILVRNNGQVWVLSPDDGEAFLDAFQ